MEEDKNCSLLFDLLVVIAVQGGLPPRKKVVLSGRFCASKREAGALRLTCEGKRERGGCAGAHRRARRARSTPGERDLCLAGARAAQFGAWREAQVSRARV
jgi:hypothetical protein